MRNTMLLAVTALMLAGTSVCAQEEVALQRTVRYGDLDLATDAGRSALQARLESAARMVCRPAEDITGLEGRMLLKNCLKTARADTAAKFDLAIAQAQRPQQIADARPTR